MPRVIVVFPELLEGAAIKNCGVFLTGILDLDMQLLRVISAKMVLLELKRNFYLKRLAYAGLASLLFCFL